MTRDGQYRSDQSPGRSAVKVLSWTPAMTDNSIAWIPPSGRYWPPKPSDRQPPVYTKWLRKFIERCFWIQYMQSHLEMDSATAPRHVSSESVEQWDDDNFLEPPAGMLTSDEDEEIITQIAVENYLLEHTSDDLGEH